MNAPSAITLVPVAAQAAALVARATGRTLVLWDRGEPHKLSEAVVSPDHWPRASGVYESIVSVGHLAGAPRLDHLLDELRPHFDADTVLFFCEPTVAAEDPTPRPPHDITTSLWRAGYTVFECRRRTAGWRPRRQEYCWGRARLTPDTSPPRRWART
jgi:hypothetical protein